MKVRRRRRRKSTKEYKERTNSNSATEPNEAVCLATLLYLLDRDKMTARECTFL